MPQAMEFQLLVEAVTIAGQERQRGQRKLAGAATLVAGALAFWLLYTSLKPHSRRA